MKWSEIKAEGFTLYPGAKGRYEEELRNIRYGFLLQICKFGNIMHSMRLLRLLRDLVKTELRHNLSAFATFTFSQIKSPKMPKKSSFRPFIEDF